MLRFRVAAALAGLIVLLSPALDAAAEGEGKIVDTKELMVPGALGEHALGDPKAPVTVIEYASLTCSHCGEFYSATFKEFKNRYIDTGKVYFVFREYPLDALSTAAFMLARCAPGDRYFEIVDLLFEEQENWAFVDNPAPALKSLLGPKGFDDAKLKACLADQKLLNEVNAVANRGQEKFGVEGTPTFFINGERHVGVLALEDIERIIKPML